jgi:small subunit ribosomal protein S21
MARAKRASINVHEWEHFGKSWKRFEKAVDDANVLQDYRDNEFYEKPSSRKKREKSMAVARERKRQREDI